jgi:probable phosphoglycerate mutase
VTAGTTTRLCIVRHGETAWNAEHRVQGQLDIPLNDLGLRQAQAVGRVLGAERFDVIYSSDLSRALQTARPTASALGMKILEDRNLRERHYGMFERQTYAEVKGRHSAEYARFAARDPDFDFGGGESLTAFTAHTRAGTCSSSRTAACLTSCTGTSRAFRPGRCGTSAFPTAA